MSSSHFDTQVSSKKELDRSIRNFSRPFCGFGFAISNENRNDDLHSLIISDVIKNGPADGKLL